MAILLKDVVPWGRSFEEYVSMFALDGADLEKRILGCGDGPAAFNADMRARSLRVLSADPVYAFDGAGIEARIMETFEDVLAQTRFNADRFVWESIPSIEALAKRRMAAMRAFLADYAEGASHGRYAACALPSLPFRDKAFELALCSHFLFLYEHHRGLAFHEAALAELCRVASEVRVFPLLNMEGTPSTLLAPSMRAMEAQGLSCRVVSVPYEFQRGGDKMLVIS